jgi:hypothetical protein
MSRLSEVARSRLRRLAISLVLLLLVSLLLMGLLTAAGTLRCGLTDPGLWPAAGVAMVTDQLAEAGLCLNGNSPRPVVYGLLDANADIAPAVSGGCMVFCSSPRWSCHASLYEDL